MEVGSVLILPSLLVLSRLSIGENYCSPDRHISLRNHILMSCKVRNT